MSDRAFLSWKIQDAMMRMQASPAPEGKQHWARVMNDAKRERGDFEPVRQESGAESTPGAIPVSASVVDPQDVPSAAARVPHVNEGDEL